MTKWKFKFDRGSYLIKHRSVKTHGGETYTHFVWTISGSKLSASCHDWFYHKKNIIYAMNRRLGGFLSFFGCYKIK
jgi:hypothetical protein